MPYMYINFEQNWKLVTTVVRLEHKKHMWSYFFIQNISFIKCQIDKQHIIIKISGCIHDQHLNS